MSDTGHTKTPWEACERGDYSDDGIVILGDDLRVAVVNREDDAAYIVTACNALPILVEALEQCAAYIQSPIRMSRDEDETARRSAIVQRARAALASIKGGE